LINELTSFIEVDMPVGSHRCLCGLGVLHPKPLEKVLSVLHLGEEGAVLELLDLEPIEMAMGKNPLGITWPNPYPRRKNTPAKKPIPMTGIKFCTNPYPCGFQVPNGFPIPTNINIKNNSSCK
jgi:hypothetical protein